jgi:translin
MEKLENIAEQIRAAFDAQTTARDQALTRARALTRACALSIRAVHRDETDVMQAHLDEARQLAGALRTELADYPALFYAGYTQDSLKEFAEANITCALIRHEHLPTPEELDLPPHTYLNGLADYPALYYAGYTQDSLKEFAEANITCALIRHESLPAPEELDLPAHTYLNGLAESVGEMRRRCLDMLRQDNSVEAERLLGYMDDIYSILVTMDYPDAITNGLRRQTDIIRAIIERTRGDVTFSLRGEKLERSISRLSEQLLGSDALPENLRLSPSPEEE